MEKLKRKKVVADVGANEIYKTYCDKYNNKHNLTQTQYGQILDKFFLKVVDNLIFKGAEFTMPYRLGNLRIRKNLNKLKLTPEGKIDKRHLRPDWGGCRKLWNRLYPNNTWNEIVSMKDKPMVYHENRHTEKYGHAWHWDKLTCLVKNNTAYTLDMSRTNDRKLATALKRTDIALDYSLF
jgi:hypothetical protein